MIYTRETREQAREHYGKYGYFSDSPDGEPCYGGWLNDIYDAEKPFACIDGDHLNCYAYFIKGKPRNSEFEEFINPFYSFPSKF